MSSSNSIVEYFGESDSECGYCKAAVKPSFGMWAHRLNVGDYQALLDRGWRRSGRYCYKPDLPRMCCCLYTIRCEALDLKLTKSQKRVLKKIQHYIESDIKAKCVSKVDQQTNPRVPSPTLHVDGKISAIETDHNIASPLGCSKVASKSRSPPEKDRNVHSENRVLLDVNFTEKQLRKAKVKRRQKKLDKLTSRGQPAVLYRRSNDQKKIEEYLCPTGRKTEPSHRLDVRLVRSNPPDEMFLATFGESFNIYKKYQIAVHRDDEESISERSYRRFLCESPLISEHFDDNRPISDPSISSAGYGSFHQQYLIDDKIVAVGVIDILNFCISSKYFFYDPQFSFLNLGVYSALREAALVRILNNYAPDIKYYYLGFYLHDNPKMIYKGRYAPSYLLCPETFTWQPIEQCLPLLNAKKFCRLNQNLSRTDNEGDVNVNRVLVLYRRSVMQFKAYKVKKKYKNDTEDEQQAKEYGMTDAHVQFSSKDKIIDNELAIRSKDGCHIDESNFDWHFENQETIDWISANGFKRVALQFPDELLYASAQVSFALEKYLGFKPYILADTSYGSCCVDDVAAQHVNADCIIHYGEACMSKTERGRAPVKYILPKSSFKEEDLVEKLTTFKKDLLGNRSLALILDVSYLHAQEILTNNVKKIIPETYRSSDFDADFASQSVIMSDCILFIGRSDSKRALLLSLMNPEKNFYVYDPAKLLEISMQDFQTNRMLRKRLYMIEKAKDAQIIGIVVGTVNVSDYLKVLERMKFLCKNASKKYYVLFVGKLNVAKLSNFADIDLFVLLSCPFGVVFDCSDYFRPIITPYEFEIACNSQKFWMSGVGWRPEPASVLKDSDSYTMNNCVPETDFSLTGGHLRSTNNTNDLPGSSSIMSRSDAYQVQTATAEHRFRDRSWKGLEEKLGETPTALVKQGRKGMASAYEDEKEQSSSG